MPFDQKKTDPKDTTSTIYRSSYEEEFGKTDCTRTTQTQWAREWPRAGGPMVCPYHFENKYRHNLFPFRIRHAVCNCNEACQRSPTATPTTGTTVTTTTTTTKTDNNSTTTSLKHPYGCLPNYLVKLALERKGCQSDGFYLFEPVFEYVPISCSCRERKFIKFN